MVLVRTEVKVLQHNGLDVNDFFSVKLRKQTKNCKKYFRGSNKNFRNAFFRDGRKPEARTFLGVMFVRLTLANEGNLLTDLGVVGGWAA